MDPAILKKLARASSTEELRKVIEVLCLPFGSLKDIRLLPNKLGGEYLCFIELDSPNEYPTLIEQVGGINFGDSVAFLIRVDKQVDD